MLSFRLKKRKKGGAYSWNEPILRLKRESPWRLAVPASIAFGLREGVFLFLINLLVYISTSSEWKVGQYMLIVIFPLLWKVSYTTLIIFGIGTSLFMPLYIIPMISSVFDLMGQNSEDAEYRVELIVLRELSMMIGRLAGIFIFILFYSGSPHMTTILWLMAGLGAAPLISWVAMRKLLAT
ncbi:hypothetical protein D3C77_437190 [compost metagenome]